MKFEILSKNKQALLGMMFFALMILFIVMFYAILALFPPTECATFFSCPSLAIPLIFAWVCSLLSVIFGIISIVKHKTISLVISVMIILAMFVTLYGILEVIFEH